jgi:peptidoglycan/LPS O-acetylase OafA/YrhL
VTPHLFRSRIHEKGGTVSFFNIGPDGMVFVYAVVVSLVLAVMVRRRIALTGAIVTTMAIAVALAMVQLFMTEPAGPFRQMVHASFIVVPSAVLLGASRVRWLSRHAWLLVALGPIAFVGCYVGICEVCAHLNLI